MEVVYLGETWTFNCACKQTVTDGKCFDWLDDTMGADGNLEIVLCADYKADSIYLDRISPNATTVTLSEEERPDMRVVFDPTTLKCPSCEHLIINVSDASFRTGTLQCPKITFSRRTSGVHLNATNVTVPDFLTAQALMEYNDFIEYLTIGQVSYVFFRGSQIFTYLSPQNETLGEITRDFGRQGLFLESYSRVDVDVKGFNLERITSFLVGNAKMHVNIDAQDLSEEFPFTVTGAPTITFNVTGGNPSRSYDLNLALSGGGSLEISSDAPLTLRGTYDVWSTLSISLMNDMCSVQLDTCQLNSEIKCTPPVGAVKRTTVPSLGAFTGFTKFDTIDIALFGSCTIHCPSDTPLYIGTVNCMFDKRQYTMSSYPTALIFTNAKADMFAQLDAINVDIEHDIDRSTTYPFVHVEFPSVLSYELQYDGDKLFQMINDAAKTDGYGCSFYLDDRPPDPYMDIDIERTSGATLGLVVMMVMTGIVDAGALIAAFICRRRLQELVLK